MPHKGLRDCAIRDYRVLRCSKCQLEFADPMAEPGRDFYAWLTRSDSYYPATRWEWSACLAEIRTLAPPTATSTLVLLDVGCGSGRFLRLLGDVPHCRAMGLDINLSSVEACSAQNLEAIHGDLATAAATLANCVDIVTLWHVVEHVADPIGLLLHAKALLTSGGRIMFSVPLSPTSYEAAWSDPLNNPPHHLTRWGLLSLQSLAARVGMNLQLIFPTADSFSKRVLHAMLVQAASPFVRLSPYQKAARLAAFVLKRPCLPLVITYHQWRRPRIDGNVLPDVALACLTTV